MFALTSKHLFWWPVTVKVPSPDNPGTFAEATFQMQFEVLPIDRGRQIDEARSAMPEQERAAHAFDFLYEVCRGWRDVNDADGRSLPFSREALTQGLQLAYFRAGVLDAYGQAMSGQEARLGNSDAPRAH